MPATPAQCRTYRRRHKARLAQYDRARDAVNRDRRRAYSAVFRALERGELVRPTRCTSPDCSHVGYVEAHHDDYTQPLNVRWLCRRCHRRAHRASG